jgi:multidrug efflux pump subunit AcrA (membrane-fusion protein)
MSNGETDRRWYIVLPIVMVIGVGALAFGLVPGVRDWLHSTFPQLGINGPTEQDKRLVEEAMASDVERSDSLLSHHDNPPTNVGSSVPELVSMQSSPFPNAPTPPVDDVQLAQATLPVGQGTQQSEQFAPRMTQIPNLPVPNGGIPVPSVTNSGALLLQSASVRFPNDITVAAQSDGIITELNVDDGTLVKAGDLMLAIDSRLAQADAEVAKQELLAAEIKANDDSSVRFAEASAAVAKQEVLMSDDLFQQGVEGKLENQKKRLEKTKADLSITVSKNDKEQHMAAVGVQQAKKGAANVQLELRSIKAPWDGVVSEVLKRQYSYVRAGEPIFRLTSMEKIRIRGYVYIQNAPHLLMNAPARVTIDIAPGKSETMDSKVMYVSPRTTTAENTYEILVEVSNRKTQDGQFLFREGMKATVEIMQGR